MWRIIERIIIILDAAITYCLSAGDTIGHRVIKAIGVEVNATLRRTRPKQSVGANTQIGRIDKQVPIAHLLSPRNAQSPGVQKAAGMEVNARFRCSGPQGCVSLLPPQVYDTHLLATRDTVCLRGKEATGVEVNVTSRCPRPQQGVVVTPPDLLPIGDTIGQREIEPAGV
jgi:hypothetical protein